jgi:hypothetical protein
VLFLVGTVLGYAWNLYFAVNYPYIYLADPTWYTLATVVSIVGWFLEAVGLFLMIYGIALRIRFRERWLVSDFTPAGIGSAAVLPSQPPTSGSRHSAASVVILGAVLILVGRVVVLAGDFVQFFLQSYDGMRYIYLNSFVGGMLEAFGLVLTLYGVALFVHRPPLQRANPPVPEPTQNPVTLR